MGFGDAKSSWADKPRFEILDGLRGVAAHSLSAGHPSAGGCPAAPVPQPGAKGRKLTFVQTEFWE